MNRAVLALLAPLLLLNGPVEARQPFSNNPSTIVRLSCGDYMGTAVKVDTDRYVSAAHVTSKGQCLIDGIPITDVSYDNDKDFVTFRGPASPVKARTSCRGYTEGETYLAVGYAFGLYETIDEPLIATSYDKNGYRVFVGEVIPGMSGGPVFDRSGRVVGIVNMRWPGRSLALKDSSYCKR